MYQLSSLRGSLQGKTISCTALQHSCKFIVQKHGNRQHVVVPRALRKPSFGTSLLDLDDSSDDEYNSLSDNKKSFMEAYQSLSYGGNQPFDAPEPDHKRDATKRIVNGKQLLINNEIEASQVRLFGQNKEQLGIVSFKMALNMAITNDVDLCLLDSTQNPPICRLISWSKYKFEVEKNEKEKKSGSAVQEIKELRLRPTTDTADVQVKLKSAMKFLKKGNKVKLTMRFEGRELQFKDQGKEVLLKFIEDIGTAGKVDGPLNFKTGTYTVLLSPIKP